MSGLWNPHCGGLWEAQMKRKAGPGPKGIRRAPLAQGTPIDRREFLTAGALAAATLALAPTAVGGPRDGNSPGPALRIPGKPLLPEDLATREDLAG